MSNYRPSPLQRVELVDDGGRWSLVFHRQFPQAPDSVWAALTEPDELREWAPYTADRSLAAVGPVTLFMTDGTELPGEVSAAQSPTRLEFTWGGDLLRWELRASDTGTALTLTHRLPERGAAAMMAAGWHICLDVAAELLAGSPIGPIIGMAAMAHGWPELNAQYSERLGVEPVAPPVQQ
ncbi:MULTISPECIES: SRPBCC family protein [unclassified Nocardia]|uniref:SRPBCC family protein n=1 Tax=unclassified Nocardia TaxID=2637762 RepID=UPI001CE40093|nr:MULTISPECIES: SRPBCC family protein [unclassified Nocardia]